MINHARTLLLNRTGAATGGYSGQLGAEYVPPDFAAVTGLPPALTNIRRLLFGADPDEVYANYRVRQYMALLHCTELYEFVTDLDSRITYDVLADELFYATAFGMTASADGMSFTGELPSPDSSGKSCHKWRISQTGAATVTIVRKTPPQTTVVESTAFTDGLSDLMTLPGTSVQFRITDQEGQVWDVVGYARPQKSLGQLAVEVRTAGAQYLNDLFGVGSLRAATEPFLTFYNLWNDHPELAYQFGGLLLAVIYYTDLIRMQNA